MKKAISIILAITILLCFAACSKSSDTKNANNENTVTEQSTISPTNQKADLDLTELSKTVVYSEVYNMLITPSDYIGKTIKMKGNFNQYSDETTGKTYNSVIIPDAAACCQQGLEFELNDDSALADTEVGSEITVIGSFDTYNEGELVYCYLKNAQIIK